MLRPKPNIEGLAPVSHGGIDYAELANLGISADQVLDFSVSTNPFGPPPGLREALSEASLDRYPDSGSLELRLSLAKKLGISAKNLIIGSGSTELIRMAATAFFGQHDTVVILKPTYGEYELACRIAGADVIHQPLSEEQGFQINLTQLLDLIQRRRPRGIFLCNPNNPTGQYLSQNQVEQIVEAAKDSLVILDEAYIAFTENTWSSLDLIRRDNVVILRSMTKDYALAGLRLGYAAAAGSIIPVLEKVKPPWNVSSMAQIAGIYALKSESYLEKSCYRIKDCRKYLVGNLTNLGFTVLPSEANFFLVKVSDAAGLRQALLGKGILVRDCTSFGLPQYIRLAARPEEECRKLIAAVKETGVNCHGS
jgi:histidinol-phosphate aminotransferase